MMRHARASIELCPSPKPKLSTITTTLTDLIRRIRLPSRTDTDFASFSNASDRIQHVLNVWVNKNLVSVQILCTIRLTYNMD